MISESNVIFMDRLLIVFTVLQRNDQVTKTYSQYRLRFNDLQIFLNITIIKSKLLHEKEKFVKSIHNSMINSIWMQRFCKWLNSMISIGK